MNYENQKRVEIAKEEANYFHNKEGETDFLHSLSWEKLYPVFRELSGNELKVWFYCYKWANNGFVWYSPATLTQDFGLSESTGQRAFKRLEQLGYIVKDTDRRNVYAFHPNGARVCSQNECIQNDYIKLPLHSF